MRGWIGRIAEALAARDRLLARNAADAAEARALEAVIPALGALAADLGLPQIEGLDVGRLADRIETRLEEAAKAFHASRTMEARYAEALRLVREAERDEAEASARAARGATGPTPRLLRRASSAPARSRRPRRPSTSGTRR